MRTTTIDRLAVFFEVLLLAVVIQSQSVTAGAQPTQHPASPDQVVRQFYDWYLHAHFPNPKKQNLAKFRKYITQKFLKQAMAPDVDTVLFIDAQDADPTWANNFSVSKATIGGQQATVEVTLNGKKVSYNLRVTLRRENGAWKTDKVKGSEWKSAGT